MLSNAATYAIRAVLYLSIHSNVQKKVDVQKISEELEVPQAFLAQLLRQLTKDRIVMSTKGRNGGFFLTEKENEKNLWEVVKCIDGTHKFDACFLGLAKCSDSAPCPVHSIVSPFTKGIKKSFKENSIAVVASEIKAGKSKISLKNIKF